MTPTAEGIPARVPLRTLLGDYPTTHALRRGALASPVVPLDFADVAVPNKAFKRVVRDLEFDVAELALMTFLMARSRDVPLRLLPVVVFSRNPLPHLVCDIERRRVTRSELSDCRIGVRAYTTTTAVWIRALMADQFGVRFDAVEWITLEEGHVAGMADPPAVRARPPAADSCRCCATARRCRHRRSRSRRSAIRCGGAGPGGDVPCVAAPARRSNPQPRDRRPRVARETTTRQCVSCSGCSVTAGRARTPRVDRASTPIGLEANRRNLEVAIAVADAQGLLARPLTVDDLVTDVVASLQ